MIHKGNNNGSDDVATGDASLDRFASALRSGLPRLPDAAMRRIERSFAAELDRAQPPTPLPMREWPRWVAVAAMFVVTVGLCWHVSTGPASPARPPVAGRVVDEYQVVLEVNNHGLSGDAVISLGTGGAASAWDSLFQSLDRYASLFGVERLTRR